MRKLQRTMAVFVPERTPTPFAYTRIAGLPVRHEPARPFTTNRTHQGERFMNKFLIALMTGLLSLTIAGCDTSEDVGDHLEDAGDEIEDAADEVKDEFDR